MAIPFIREFEPHYGELVKVTPLISRVVANNPGPFTFKGTGVYIAGGNDVAVIDPGPDMPEHIEALKRALTGKRVTHVLVTHTHSDHSPAAKPLKEWSGAKTYAFGPHGSGRDENEAKVEAGGDMDFVPDIRVKDGEIIAGSGFTFEAVSHARAHVEPFVLCTEGREGAVHRRSHHGLVDDGGDTARWRHGAVHRQRQEA